MAEIDGGALSFKSVMDNGQLITAVEETLRRIKGLSDGTVAESQKMDEAFNLTAQSIQEAYQKLDAAGAENRRRIQELEEEYRQLGIAAGGAYSKEVGGAGYRTDNQLAIEGEIKVRQQLLNEIDETANKLVAYQKRIDETGDKTVTLRTQIRQLKNEMASMVDLNTGKVFAGQEAQYESLKTKLGLLVDLQGDINQQGKELANDERLFQGTITGISGITGAFTAATGAVSLFAGENEDLQKIMAKIQSAMAMTMGLQQVAQTLNKDSAFRLVIVNGLKDWWKKAVEQSAVAEIKETATLTANTVAQEMNAKATGQAAAAEAIDTAAKGANTVAAGTGTVANLTLAGAFRAVGAAIKSIPVFGWIITAIAGLATVIGLVTKKSRDAAKEQKEFTKAIVEGAYKPIGSIVELSAQYEKLGNDLKAKKQFIDDNKKAFDELGVSILDVADAENLLVKNKDAFIQAQIAKAKALAITESDNYKKTLQKSIEAQINVNREAGNFKRATGKQATAQTINGESKIVEGSAKLSGYWDDLQESNKELKFYTDQSLKYMSDYNKGMEKIGGKTKEITKGTSAWYDKMISDLGDKRKNLLPNSKEFKQVDSELKNLEKQRDKIFGTGTTSISNTAPKDAFLEGLDEKKKEYQTFSNWVNSDNKVIANAAATEFSGLLKQGATYLEYLQKLRDKIITDSGGKLSAKQKAQITDLNNEIAQETKKTSLDLFNQQLDTSLQGADTILGKLQQIENLRKTLKNDGTELDISKKEKLDEAEGGVMKQANEDYKKAVDDYKQYQDDKLKEDERYLKEKAKLEKQLAEATTPVEKKAVQTQLDTLNTKHDMTQQKTYDDLIEQYKNYQQRVSDISKDYDEKIALATKNKNLDLVAELKKAKEKALNEAADEEFKNSDIYIQLIQSVSEEGYAAVKKANDKAKEIINSATENTGVNGKKEYTITIDTVDSQGNPIKKSLQISEQAFDEFKSKVKENNNYLTENNPFQTLINGIKDFQNAETEAVKSSAILKIAQGFAGAASFINAQIQPMLKSLDNLGVVGIDDIKKITDQLNDMAQDAAGLAMGIATGNTLQIISSTIGLITKGIDLVTGIKDRALENSITKHKENVDKLTNAYKQLEYQVNKSLGTETYKNQEAEIENMKNQQAELNAMIAAEDAKKKTDKDKITEWQNQINDLNNSIQDTIESIAKDVLQTDAKSFADDLGNALVEAFGKGEDAATAFGDTVNKVIKDAVLNQLKKQFLEKQLQGALDTLYADMGGQADGTFVFNGLSDAEIAAFKSQVSTIATGFNQALGEYGKVFTDLTGTSNETSLSGAVKGVTEQTADILSGQINAMRINQIEANAIIRQQLMHLANIDQNTSYNVNLLDIRNDIREMKNAGNSLRSQGL